MKSQGVKRSISELIATSTTLGSKNPKIKTKPEREFYEFIAKSERDEWALQTLRDSHYMVVAHLLFDRFNKRVDEFSVAWDTNVDTGNGKSLADRTGWSSERAASLVKYGAFIDSSSLPALMYVGIGYWQRRFGAIHNYVLGNAPVRQDLVNVLDAFRYKSHEARMNRVIEILIPREDEEEEKEVEGEIDEVNQ